MIRDFIFDVCEMLEIPEPRLVFDTKKFTKDTMLAQCSPDGSEIRLKYNNSTNPDTFFCIAHELRHIYQLKYAKEIYFSAYKPKEECKTTEEYNIQLAEIDANAFAGFVMISFFSVEPLYQGLSDNIKEMIFDRIGFLVEEYCDFDD